MSDSRWQAQRQSENVMISPVSFLNIIDVPCVPSLFVSLHSYPALCLFMNLAAKSNFTAVLMTLDDTVADLCQLTDLAEVLHINSVVLVRIYCPDTTKTSFVAINAISICCTLAKGCPKQFSVITLTDKVSVI